MTRISYIVHFSDIRMTDIDNVGGKNASLGEMTYHLKSAGIRVPTGFATTAEAYREFLEVDGLGQRIERILARLDPTDVKALALSGATIRKMILDTPLQADLLSAIEAAYLDLVGVAGPAASFAVRSSATAEDLPDASFAGQQETFLNVHGLQEVIQSVHHVFASLFNDRAISYRAYRGFIHSAVALSAGVQQMVRSDIGASGVMFTLDTETGFRDAVLITSSWGLGELVVQGAVNPDEFYVHKPMLAAGKNAIIRRSVGSKLQKMSFGSGVGGDGRVLTVETEDEERNSFSISDGDVLELSRYAMDIERHYGCPMDIEWAKDGLDGRLYILQARPETVKSRDKVGRQQQFALGARSEIIVSGRAIGTRIGKGTVRVVSSAADMSVVEAGDVLVTTMTDPDWEPVMKRSAAIVTDRGGRTCHAAIIARELGIPAVVGCGNATTRLKNGMQVTVSCADGDTGNVYEGLLDIDVTEVEVATMPPIPVKIMMNVGNPGLAFGFQALPNDGVGLARMEFIINNMIGLHPRAVLDYPNVPAEVRRSIQIAAAGYANPQEFFVTRLREGIATIAAAFWPKPVIVRLSDFKSNEYRKLIGGNLYEPDEENPMLGFRGASRYIDPAYRESFRLECEALKAVRDDTGLTNVQIMIPFVRTVAECRAVIELLKGNGLSRGANGLRVVMMCEIPSNALLAKDFLEWVDGYSIGSNDLTQLTLGLDRDSGLVAAGFDERNPAVKVLLSMAIRACRDAGKYVGICGQGPSDHPDLAQWLLEQGIDSISLNPDTVVATWRLLGSSVAATAS
jgi:pyruvate,water dikinase